MKICQLEDGLYTVDVQLEGGSGRAGITSPAELTVQSGKKSRGLNGVALTMIIWWCRMKGCCL